MASSLHGSIEQLAMADVYRDPRDALYKVRRSFLLTPSFGCIFYRELDLGFPEIRAAVTDLSDSSGTYDETTYHGARAISLSLTVIDDAFVNDYGWTTWDQSIDWNSDAYWVTRLASWMSPEMRPRLYFKLKGQSGNARFVDLRPAGFTAPNDGSGVREVQMQWVNPSGKIYDFDQSTLATLDGRTRNEIRQQGVTDEGTPLPFTMPLTFPDVARGSTSVVYSGSVSNGFIARIRSDPGTATVNPRITVTGPDGVQRSIGFTGLTIPAGQFLEIDTNERTVSLNGDPNLRQNQYLTAPLAWPVFKPGENQVQFAVGAGGSVGTNAYVETLHYSAFLA